MEKPSANPEQDPQAEIRRLLEADLPARAGLLRSIMTDFTPEASPAQRANRQFVLKSAFAHWPDFSDEQLQELEETIVDFSQYKDGWSGKNSKRPHLPYVADLLAVVSALEPNELKNIVPLSSSGVQAEWWVGEEEIDLIVDPLGIEMVSSFTDDDKAVFSVPFVEAVTEAHLRAANEELRKFA